MASLLQQVEFCLPVYTSDHCSAYKDKDFPEDCPGDDVIENYACQSKTFFLELAGELWLHLEE